MTTAPDLPMAVPSVAVPAQTEDVRPQLALVKPAAAPDSEIVDFDDALRAATPRLVRYATRRLADPHEAEEVVQEALLRAFQHRDTLRTHDDLMAWLTVVTGRLVIDRVRVRGRMTPVAELPPTSRTGRDTADVVVARDEARIALDALEAMPTRQASVLWAREVDGLSYDEISERYGLSEPTVRSLLHRARRTLRREYAERGGTLPSLGLVALAPWLRGLRSVGRLRTLGRRTAAAAAATATGLTIATVSPLWSSHAPAPAPAAAPAMTMKANAAAASPAAPAARVRPAPARHQVVVRPVGAVAPARHYQAVRLPKAAGCYDGHGVDCTTPKDVLFLGVPVHGKVVGVSVEDVSCSTLPATALTHCESAPSTGKN
ncbi:MAG TPA: RNA polymerase sigma factor [Mycobacteriales bacterium]|nr:RNA polymerase sigma factor [Mycobacteriales bacterium]